MDQNEFVDDLDKKIWRTKGARFNAYRRLLRRQNIVTYVTSFSSIHILIISVIQISSIFCLTSTANNLLSLISIALSLIILVYGLIEGGKQYGLLAERFHSCGLDLGRLYDEFLIEKAKENSPVTEKLAKRYADILERCGVNHEPIDDEYFQYKHQHEFGEFKKKSYIRKATVIFGFNWLAITLAVIASVAPVLITIVVVSKF